MALGFVGDIFSGADKLARIAHLAHDPTVAEVLGIEAHRAALQTP